MKTIHVDPRASDARLDDAIRAHYAGAVANVSSGTRAQLHNRLRTAHAPPPTAHVRRPAWGLAAVCSLALATAIGLQFQGPRVPPDPAPAPAVAASTHDNGELLASLDEEPDLYLWLASDDASSLVPE